MVEKLLRKLFKVKIKYVDEINGGYAGKFYGYPFRPVIKIKKEYKDDKGLLEHELTHYEQYIETWMLWEILYKIKHFRIVFETQAYARQWKTYIKQGLDPEETLNPLATYLATKYDLDMSINDAKEMIKYAAEKNW